MKGKKPFKPHKREPFRPEHTEARSAVISISEVSNRGKGSTCTLVALVDRIVQTGGPTVFYVSDGTGTLALKGFEGAGVRSYPDVNEGDALRAVVSIDEFRDELEGEILSLTKLNETEKHEFSKKLAEIERTRAAVTPIPFLVHSPILEKLKDRFISAATEIRLAIIQNRPIIVRHHNDADGYSSGYALERAIIPLIEKQHGAGGKAAWEYYTRAPCAAPFYDIEDSIKDTAHSLSDAAKFSNKIPLVIITDTGSGEEDLLAIQQGKVHGADFIVVDHHMFEKDVISKEVLVHINPFLVGEDGAKISAGMLCAELARFINAGISVAEIPAMAGLADRIDNPPVMDAYLEHAAKEGYTKHLLTDIAAVIDFVSSKLRFMEAREYIEVLFGEPRDKQKQLVNLLAPYIRGLEEKAIKIAQSAVKTELLGKVTFQILPIEETFSRGAYPKPGKVVGLVHDAAQTDKKLTKVVSIGLLQDAITIRATDQAQFSVHDLIHKLHTELPNAFVEGGGHKNAGSIKFVPNQQQAVLTLLKTYIKSLRN